MQVTAQTIRTEGATLRCTKCVLTLNPESKIQVIAEEIAVGGVGTVRFRGTVRLKLVNGEVVANGGTLTTDSNGTQHFTSDELQFVSSSIR